MRRVLGSLREVPGRVPLRVRLVAALVLLGALALAATGVAASTALRSSLVARVDSQLGSFADRSLRDGVDPHANRGDPQLPSAFFVAVVYPDGRVAGTVFQPLRRNEARPDLPRLRASDVAERANRPFTVGADLRGGHEWRVLARPLPDGSGTVVVALSLDDVDNTVGQLLLITAVVSSAVLLLLAVGGYLVVRSSLRPLVEVEHTAEAIAAGDLSRRVPDRDPRTEVGRLGRSLNAMLGQIESAFHAREQSEAGARRSEERMRQFVADASHELRTPLASIRGFAELYRQGAVPQRSDVDRVMRRIEDQAVRMGMLVEDLLLLARVDQQRPLEYAPVDLLAVATDAVHDARAVAPDRSIELELLASDRPPVVLGDDARIRQVTANLVSNALTHTPADAAVRVRIGTLPGPEPRAVFEVADEGPGLTPEEAGRVFERFYRADPSRTRASGGSGLGLSIVAALVSAHGGTVDVQTAPGQGAVFRVLLPLPADEPPADDPDDPGDAAGDRTAGDASVAGGRRP
jgi:two-component system OmpR family sensor kinase